MIGASFVLGLRQAGLVGKVIGVDVAEVELATAKTLGIIDETATIDTLPPVDLIIIATPVGVMPRIFNALAHYPWLADTLITDVGSTKQSVIAAAEAAFPDWPRNFVPGHPVAGREYIGVAYAVADMFDGFRVVLTPHEKNDHDAVMRVAALWQACGAHVEQMSASAHDRVLAATSHLPHVLSYCLMESLATTEYETSIFDYAAGGFKSFTRTASSNPVMWRDICLNNNTDILYWLDHYLDTLAEMRDLIADEAGDELLAVYERAKSIRDNHIHLTQTQSVAKSSDAATQTLASFMSKDKTK